MDQSEAGRRIRSEEEEAAAEREEMIRKVAEEDMSREIILALQEHSKAVSEATLELITSCTVATAEAQNGAMASILNSARGKEDNLRRADSQAGLRTCISLVSKAVEPPPPSYASSQDHYARSTSSGEVEGAMPADFTSPYHRAPSPRNDAAPMRLFEFGHVNKRSHAEEGTADAAGQHQPPPPPQSSQPAMSVVSQGVPQPWTPGKGTSTRVDVQSQPKTPVQGSKPAASLASTPGGGSQPAASPVGRWDFGDQGADEVSLEAGMDAAVVHSKTDIRFLF